MSTATTGRLLRLSEVIALTGYSCSSIYRKMRDVSFPEPLKMGARAVRWRESEIEAWLAARPRAHRGYSTMKKGSALGEQKNMIVNGGGVLGNWGVDVQRKGPL